MYKQPFYIYGVKDNILFFHRRYYIFRNNDLEIDILHCPKSFIEAPVEDMTWVRFLIIPRTSWFDNV